MSETSGTGGKPAASNIAIYVLCAVVGVAAGVIGTLAFTGGGGSAGDPVVATFGGKSIKASEAFANVKTRLFEVEEDLYRTKEQAINDFIEARLLENEAKKQNLPVEKLVEKETGGPVGEVTDKEIDDFLNSKGLNVNDPRIRKSDVSQYLQYRKQLEKRQVYVGKLKETANVKVLLKEPESPKISVATEGFPSWGNPKAPVTIIEFSDFQCPFCSRAIPTIDKIKAEYGPDKVRIVFMDMPLPSHPRAKPASMAAHCANDQGKFWEYHNGLFQNQSKLEDADLKALAKTLTLDEAKFNECYDGKKHAETVAKAQREGEKAGIQATPSFVINGALLQGAQPFEKFKEKIDRASKS